jgi:TPR repeat protein
MRRLAAALAVLIALAAPVVAQSGDAQEKMTLAKTYLDESSGSFDYNKGEALMREAAEAGLAEAQYQMGMLSLGAFGNLPDLPGAVQWFDKAVAQGHAGARYQLGVLYLEGLGVPKDSVKAAALIGEAAQQGNADAMLDYGVLVFRGEGVKQDEKIGAQWLLLSARRGNVIAQNRLARVLAFGRGADSDPVEALKWHLLATRAGRGDAELDTLLGKLTETQKKEAEARADAFKPAAAPSN